MKTLDFKNFLLESADDLPPTVKLAKLGLSPGISVIEWSADVDPNSPDSIKIVWSERYAWPEKSADDDRVQQHADVRVSRGGIERKMSRWAKQNGFDWVHDMERDTWKKVD